MNAAGLVIYTLTATLHAPEPITISHYWWTMQACEQAGERARVSALWTRRKLSWECEEVALD